MADGAVVELPVTPFSQAAVFLSGVGSTQSTATSKREQKAELLLDGAMQLDKMEENDWKYHGEGNKNLVVAHVKVTRRC